MSEQMEFPETFEDFAEEYVIKDYKEVYTNGVDLIPIFRVKQWLEHVNKWSTVTEGLPIPEQCEEDIVGNSAYEYLTMPNPYKKSEEE